MRAICQCCGKQGARSRAPQVWLCDECVTKQTPGPLGSTEPGPHVHVCRCCGLEWRRHGDEESAFMEAVRREEAARGQAQEEA